MAKTGIVEMLQILMKLTECVGDQSVLLCLSLAALMLESPSTSRQYSVINSLSTINTKSSDGLSLYKMIKRIQNDEQSAGTSDGTVKSKDAAVAEEAKDKETAIVNKLDDETRASIR